MPVSCFDSLNLFQCHGRVETLFRSLLYSIWIKWWGKTKSKFDSKRERENRENLTYIMQGREQSEKEKIMRKKRGGIEISILTQKNKVILLSMKF